MSSVLVSNGVYLTPTQETLELTVKFPGTSSISALEALINFMETGELQPTIDNIEKLLLVTLSFLWEREAALKILVDFFYDDMSKRYPGQIDRSLLLMYCRIWTTVECSAYVIGFKILRHIMIGVNDRGQEKGQYCFLMNITIFIAAGFQSIMFDKFVLDLPVEYIRCLLDADLLNLSEEDVLKTIKMWINHDFEARRIHFPDLIRSMRFDKDMKVFMI